MRIRVKNEQKKLKKAAAIKDEEERLKKEAEAKQLQIEKAENNAMEIADNESKTSEEKIKDTIKPTITEAFVQQEINLAIITIEEIIAEEEDKEITFLNKIKESIGKKNAPTKKEIINFASSLTKENYIKCIKFIEENLKNNEIINPILNNIALHYLPQADFSVLTTYLAIIIHQNNTFSKEINFIIEAYKKLTIENQEIYRPIITEIYNSFKKNNFGKSISPVSKIGKWFESLDTVNKGSFL